MELVHLRTFVAVAEAGSLTRAAEAVHLSQPAVSGHIKALEQTLGVQLFRRAPRGMALTDAGQMLLREAKDVLHRADGVTRLAQRLRGEVAGTLCLGIIDCGYDLKLARIVGAITRQHPDLELKLIASNSGDNTLAVLDQQIDIAAVEGEVDDDRLHAWRLGTSRVGVIGPAEWRGDLRQAGWARLGEFPWVFQSRGCSYCRLLEQISEREHLEFRPQFRADAFGAVRELVAEGLALSLADLDEIAPLVEDGKVFIWPHFEHTMPVQLIALRSRVAEPMLASFAETALGFHAGGSRRRARPLSAAD